jgi:hypothetical protein
MGFPPNSRHHSKLQARQAHRGKIEQDRTEIAQSAHNELIMVAKTLE